MRIHNLSLDSKIDYGSNRLHTIYGVLGARLQFIPSKEATKLMPKVITV